MKVNPQKKPSTAKETKKECTIDANGEKRHKWRSSRNISARIVKPGTVTSKQAVEPSHTYTHNAIRRERRNKAKQDGERAKSVIERSADGAQSRREADTADDTAIPSLAHGVNRIGAGHADAGHGISLLQAEVRMLSSTRPPCSS